MARLSGGGARILRDPKGVQRRSSRDLRGRHGTLSTLPAASSLGCVAQPDDSEHRVPSSKIDFVRPLGVILGIIVVIY
jgi:hypothetical protein